MKFSRSEEKSLQPEDEGKGSHLPAQAGPSFQHRMESRPANVGFGQDKVRMARGPIFRGERDASALG